MTRPRGYASWRPQRKTEVILDQIDQVLDEYSAYLPLTVRQVFYRLVGVHGFPKTETAYKRVAEYLNRGRRSGRFPWDAIRDDGAEAVQHRITRLDRARWLDAMLPHPDDADHFHGPGIQDGQPVFTEVWCEANGMVPMLGRMVEPYGINVYGLGGFESVTTLRNHAERHRDHWYLNEDMPVRVLLIGDYDGSGLSIGQATESDVVAFGSMARFERVAILPDQIVEYGLPTVPPKAGDHRHGFDEQTVQAEALPPDVLESLLTEAIEEEWDSDAAEAANARLVADRAWLRERLTEMQALLGDLDNEDE